MDLSGLKIDRGDATSAGAGKAVAALAGVAVIVVAAWAGYRQWMVPRQTPAVRTAIAKPPVNVANPALFTATGYLVAERQAKITPKISGKIVKLHAETGLRVRRGDVLAVLESTSLQAQLRDANAASWLANRELDRQRALWEQGISSRAALDAAEAQLRSAQARVESVRIDIRDMVIRAPFDGTIATKNSEVGEVVSSTTLGQVAGTLPSGAICTLVDLNTLQVIADVNETSVGQLHEGQPAVVTVDAFPGRSWRGLLTEIVPTADRAKAVVQVKVAILDPKARLLPEMSATVSFLRDGGR
ncbi:MAG TPA: efflux RND transporter periplasmic adaptor subunit [Vicinamibacterales bacterium]